MWIKNIKDQSKISQTFYGGPNGNLSNMTSPTKSYKGESKDTQACILTDTKKFQATEIKQGDENYYGLCEIKNPP